MNLAARALMLGAGCLRDPLHCVTCSDEAVRGRVLRIGSHGIASVQFEAAIEKVSLELIEAAPGDIVLVHAGVAIARLENEEASSGQE
jgi:hydrogenase expression/formation protein HypC